MNKKIILVAVLAILMTACTVPSVKDILSFDPDGVAEFIIQKLENRDNRVTEVAHKVLSAYCKLPEEVRESIRKPYEDIGQYQCN